MKFKSACHTDEYGNRYWLGEYTMPNGQVLLSEGPSLGEAMHGISEQMKAAINNHERCLQQLKRGIAA
jgi:hypothetical protein